MSRPDRTPVAESRYPIPYWDSLTPQIMYPREMIVSKVLVKSPEEEPLSISAMVSSSCSMVSLSSAARSWRSDTSDADFWFAVVREATCPSRLAFSDSRRETCASKVALVNSRADNSVSRDAFVVSRVVMLRAIRSIWVAFVAFC